MGKRLNDLVRETLTDVDVVVFCVPANEKIGPGDRFITRDLAELRTPVVAVVTKADTVTREALAAQLLAVSELGEWADIVPGLSPAQRADRRPGGGPSQVHAAVPAVVPHR